MSDASFRGDCGRCDALCCTALAFDRGPHFAIDKPAGERCPNLAEDHRCALHDRLAAAGFSGCAAYDCLGAGQLATSMFAGLDVASPSVRRARYEAFARLRQLQALRLASERLGKQIGPPASYAELLRLDLSALRQTVVGWADAMGADRTDQMLRSADTIRKSP
jgi:hypothetical protein